MKKFLITTLLLVPFVASASNRIIDGKFIRADIDNDNRLSRAEFLVTQAVNISEVKSQYRFDRSDKNLDGFVDRLEFRESRGGAKAGNPSRIESFRIADLDSDGVLDPSEYASILGHLTSARRVSMVFDRLDKDDDGVISPREFGVPLPV